MIAGSLGLLTLSRLNRTPALRNKLAQQQAATLSPRMKTLLIKLSLAGRGSWFVIVALARFHRT
jgi:hypothetical protein